MSSGIKEINNLNITNWGKKKNIWNRIQIFVLWGLCDTIETRDGQPVYSPGRYLYLFTAKNLTWLMAGVLQFKKDKIIILKKLWQVNFSQKSLSPLIENMWNRFLIEIYCTWIIRRLISSFLVELVLYHLCLYISKEKHRKIGLELN